jgi:hypothetical protein
VLRIGRTNTDGRPLTVRTAVIGAIATITGVAAGVAADWPTGITAGFATATGLDALIVGDPSPPSPAAASAVPAEE